MPGANLVGLATPGLGGAGGYPLNAQRRWSMEMNLEPELKPGDLIMGGKYRVEALLGQGAFAQVYRVHHLELRIDRAVKVVSPDTPGVGSTVLDDFRARFRQEAQLGARVDHPHVIRIYDFEEAGGRLYLVMEYAAGGSLAGRLRDFGPFPVVEATGIILEAAAGLEALHKLSVVHRDVKPSNILLDGEGHAKIADLGLAQMPGSTSQRSRLGSMASSHPGTPEYMSPEQGSSPEYLTASSDVYSLGCVWFELLTGRAWAGAMREVDDVRQLRPEVPVRLAQVLARMCQPEPARRKADTGDPNKRYLSMEAVRQALLASGQSAPARVHPGWLMAGIGLVIVLLAGLAAWWLAAGSRLVPALLVAQASPAPTAAVARFSPPMSAAAATSTPAAPAPGSTSTPTPASTVTSTPLPSPSPIPTRTPSATSAPAALLTPTAVPSTSTTAPARIPTAPAIPSPTPAFTPAPPSATAPPTPPRTSLPTVTATGTSSPADAISPANAADVVQLAILYGDAAVDDLVFTPDDRSPITVDQRGTIVAWDVGSGWPAASWEQAGVWTLAISPDGRLIAGGSTDDNIYVWDLAGALVRELKGHSAAVSRLAFNPTCPDSMAGCQSALVSGGYDNRVRLWELDSGDSTVLIGHVNPVTAVAFNPNGRNVMSGSHNGSLIEWNIHTGRQIDTLGGHSGTISTIAFSHGCVDLQGSCVFLMASSGDDCRILLWDALSGRQVGELQHTHTASINSVAFSPDGTLLATASSDFSVHLFDVRKNHELRVLTGHTDFVNAVAFSPSGRWLASGSADRTVRLWGMKNQ